MICARATWRVDSVGAHREGRRLKWLSTREHVVYRHTYPSLCDCHSAVCTTRCVWCLEVVKGMVICLTGSRPREAVEPVLRGCFDFCSSLTLFLAGAQL